MTASEQIERARNIYDELSDTLESLNQEEADSVEEALEEAAESLEEAAECDDEDEEHEALEEALGSIQEAQEGFDDLEASAHEQDVELDLDAIEDAIEQAEDSVTDELLDLNPDDEGSDDGEEAEWDVTVSDQTKVLDSQTIEPIELLRTFDYNPNQYVLYPCEEEEKVPKDSEINLAEDDCFDAIPSDTAYGEQALEEVLEAEIEELREDYTVDVEPDEEPNFTHVIVRDYPVPSSAYNMGTVDVMIRVHENYPQKAPDWVYVDPEFRLENGGMPHKSSNSQVRGWLGLSWHINKLGPLEWEPLETGLRWYLNQVVHSRLRQGE